MSTKVSCAKKCALCGSKSKHLKLVKRAFWVEPRGGDFELTISVCPKCIEPYDNREDRIMSTKKEKAKPEDSMPKDCLKQKRGLKTFRADWECSDCPSFAKCLLIDHTPEVNKWED